MFALQTAGTPLLWLGFTVLVVALLALDLGVFHRKAHVVGVREALVWTGVWMAFSLVFALGVYVALGSRSAVEFVTGYVLEKALSVDNIFVFMVVFSSFATPPKLQHRVLFWGILGALGMRALFIFVGAAALQRFHWISYLFGAFLVVTGLKLLARRSGDVHPENNPLFRRFRQLVPSVNGYRDAHFTVVTQGRRYATPLLLVLVAIEATDVAFAVDSIPAVFAVTTDPFIVYTSNIFAILGLRSLYFALAGAMKRMPYLKVGLATVLVYVGLKMLVAPFLDIPPLISLGVVVALLAGAILAPLVRSPGPRSTGCAPGHAPR